MNSIQHFVSPLFRMKQFFQSINRFYLSTAITVFLICYAGLLLLPGSSFLKDPDTFWHIRTGQWILDHVQFPTVDFFSYTASGKPWISTEWLSEIFFAVAFRFGGWRAVVVLAVISTAAIVGILVFYLVRYLRFSVAIGWAVLTTLAISPHFLARPHIFSYVLVAIWLIKLLDAYDSENPNLPSLGTLVPLMVFWANVHGSFTFGLALLYVFGGVLFFRSIVRREYNESRHHLLIVSIVSISALITPYGISSALMTIKLLDLKFTISHIEELHSPDFQVYRIHLVLFVGLVAAIVGLGIRLGGAKLIAFSLIMLVGLSYLRGLVMFFFLAPLILARPASQCVSYLKAAPANMQSSDNNKVSDPVLRYLQKRLIAIPVVCMAVAALVSVSTWWREDIIPSKDIAPNAAIDFVRRTNITGNVFNSYNFGGFLVFSDIPTFVDGRALPFGDGFLHKYFDAVDLIDIDGTFQMLDDYKISWVILRPLEPISRALAQSVFWDKVYSDKYSVVFTRRQ
jgi:hypothetical protein